MSPHALLDTTWKIVTVREPLMFHRTEDEVWLLNPNRRYVLNAHQVSVIGDLVDTVSDMAAGNLHRPLRAGHQLAGASILVERLRERGIGDLMFLTGPFAFFQHVSGHGTTVDVYTLSDRGAVLRHNPHIRNGTPLCGVLEYEALQHYNYHWFIGAVTEFDCEPDQLNVYDALYKMLGFDPASIDAQWKRPRAVCLSEDFQHLDQLFRMIWEQRKIDLRRTGYYVVAPFAAATLRSMSYARWLEIISALAERRPVVVVGSTRCRLPDMDMSAGAFIQRLAEISSTTTNVLMAFDGTPLRVLMALIARAKAVVCLDSGPLYLAQGLRVPAVSLWGPVAPEARVGYDADYMDLALWEHTACPASPCFSFLEFPQTKCPKGRFQTECEVLSAITVDAVMNRIDRVESTSTAYARKP